MPTIPFHKPGVTYNGLHATEHPTVGQVTADLATAKLHFELVRTYYPQYGGGVVDVGKIAKDVDLKLLLGLFLFESIRTGPPATTINSSSRRSHAATSPASLSATRTRK